MNDNKLIYYIVRNNSLSKHDIGFFKKFYGQIDVFKNYGIVHFIYISGKDIKCSVFKNNEEEVKTLATYNHYLVRHFFFFFVILKYMKDYKPSMVYHRYKMSEGTFINFLKKVKKKFNAIIFVEFPTFPYDNNWGKESLCKKVLLPIDKFYRTKLKKYVNLAITYYNNNSIFGISTVKIANGINIDDIKKIEEKPCFTNCINLLAVASLGFWHGYDRVIRGIAEFKKKNSDTKVLFNIVGEGKEKANLEKLVNDLNLQDSVIFLGTKRGEELNSLFEKAHVAVNTIGWHRMKVEYTDTLKAREYCARGIPFVSAGKDFSFNNDFKYIYKVEENDDPIDISKIISFYKDIKEDNYIDEMRNYAKENLTWHKQFEKVKRKVDEIEKVSNSNKRKKIKIAIVFPKDSEGIFNKSSKKTFGGATTQLYNIGVALSEEKNIEIFSLIGKYNFTEEDRKKLNFVTQKKNTFLFKLFLYLKLVFIINPDYVLQRGLSPFSPFISIALSFFRIKYLFMFAHDNEVSGCFQKDNKKCFLFKALLKKSYRLFVQNNFQKETIEKRYNIKTYMLKSGYFLKKEDINIKDSVLWVSRLEPWKRAEIFINLAKKLPNYKFQLIGPQYRGFLFYENKIKEMAKDVNNLELIGFVPFDEIDNYFNKAKIFVNTSKREGFPNTFIQSFLASTPVVSLSVNPDNIFSDSSVGIYCDDDEEKMKETIIKLFSDEEMYKKMSEKAYLKAEEEYDIRKNVKSFLSIIS